VSSQYLISTGWMRRSFSGIPFGEAQVVGCMVVLSGTPTVPLCSTIQVLGGLGFLFLVVTRAASGRLEVCLSLIERLRLKSQLGTCLEETSPCVRNNIVYRAYVITSSGSCKFCRRRRVSLPASMETTHAPRAPFVRTFLPSFIWF